MSGARPKLIQEGAPLNNGNGGGSFNGNGNGEEGGDLARQNSRFRLIVGGSVEDDPRGAGGAGPGVGNPGVEQQGYDNFHSNSYHNNYHHNNYHRDNYHHNNYNSYRGRGYYNGGRGGYYRGGRGRGRGRGYGYGGGYGRGRYGYNPRWHGGRGRYNRHSYSNGFYNTSSGYNDHHFNSYSSGFNSSYHNDGYVPDANKKDFFEPSEFRKGNVQTRLVVGGGDSKKDACTMEIIPQTYNEELHQLESLQGTVALDDNDAEAAATNGGADADGAGASAGQDNGSASSDKPPLVVMDGTNLSFAYSDAMGSKNADTREPNYRGMQVASDYFLSVGVRVLIVLPADWFRVKSGDHSKETTIIKINVLQDLKEKGLLVAAPPDNENDAMYALKIARNASKRSRNPKSGGYVLSNDTFQDVAEDEARAWLMDGNGKISFAFCDMGSLDATGGRMLDFIPNPRHPLVIKLEKEYNGNNSD